MNFMNRIKKAKAKIDRDPMLELAQAAEHDAFVADVPPESAELTFRFDNDAAHLGVFVYQNGTLVDSHRRARTDTIIGWLVQPDGGIARIETWQGLGRYVGQGGV